LVVDGNRGDLGYDYFNNYGGVIYYCFNKANNKEKKGRF